MIYPTRRTILIAAALAPVTLLIGVAAPSTWLAGLALLAGLLLLIVADAFAAAPAKAARIAAEGPASAGVGEMFEIGVEVAFAFRAPSHAELALGAEGPLEAPQGYRRIIRPSEGEVARFPLRAMRRGTGTLERVWLRWQGPLGLAWRQKVAALDRPVLLTPDISAVRQAGAQMLNRDSLHGMRAQLQIGEGAEFDALTDYRQGMDRRAIDWKQSARHTALIAKGYRTERNNQIVMAIDAGRAMCEPVAGMPRVDRAVSAALLTAYVALKDGDRVGLFGFDSKPRVASKPVSGQRSFALLQRVAAAIDYSPNETNYTLALTTLAAGLHRRALVVVFTDFADTISAELMLAAVSTLLKRHLVLFVVLRDEELEGLAAAEPREAEDVSRAVAAASLLAERRLVLTRLRHLGVHVLEAPADEAGPALLSAYLGFKRRNLL
ncbi:MAG: DUF58 domain-containing protein [Allosphingosinicella sp.]|uniref:DUF58 domain-containing protein n=1 Tax=Allosphingosinicella sp. TaxID=2823234 RepID=UPI0039397507